MAEERCYKEVAPDGPSLFQNGKLVIQTHHIGWLVSGVFTLIACGVSFWLIDKHLQWYHNKHEQRHIVRILFLVPIYAIVSLASYFFWNHSTPIILVRDCYESTVLTSFFYLLLLYLSPDHQTQQMIFAKEGLSYEQERQAIRSGTTVKKWVLPLGWVKWKPADGLYFLQLMKWGVLQYCVIRPVCTLAAVILDYAGLYCEASWGLGWGHIYLTIVISISVTIAMYCLIQLYVAVSEYLAPQKPLLKLFAIKAVVFLTFWQATFLSVLTMFGVVKDTKYMTAEDVNIGIGALLETFEMACFALVHVKAFTYKIYIPYYLPDSTAAPIERTPRLRSLGHAFDFRETARELWVGTKYMWQKARGREPKLDRPAKRQTYYESVFGRPRIADLPAPVEKEKNRDAGKEGDMRAGREKDAAYVEEAKATLPDVPLDDDLDAERQWLGGGDVHKYDLHVGYLQRERSEGLEKQFERELTRRGYIDRKCTPYRLSRRADNFSAYDPDNVADSSGAPSGHRQQRSWWRNVYNRISQTGHEPSDSAPPATLRHASRQPSRPRRHRPRDSQEAALQRRLLDEEIDYDEPPPPGLYSPTRTRGPSRSRYTVVRDSDLDTEAPPSRFRPPGASPSSPRSQHQDASSPRNEPPYAATRRLPLDRVDSVMARIFPASQNPSSTALHHPAASVQSLPSVSADGVAPPRATPRARLMTGTPMPTGLSAVGERRLDGGLSEVRGAGSQEAHVMHMTAVPEFAHTSSDVSHTSPTSRSPRSPRSPRQSDTGAKRSRDRATSNAYQRPVHESVCHPTSPATSHFRDAAYRLPTQQPTMPSLPPGAGYPRLSSFPKGRPVPRMPAPLAQRPHNSHTITPPDQSYDPMDLGGDIYFSRPS
ncbi:organic solute transporter Ostalpha-domain-containing protein [Schizophyllum commune]